MVETYKDWHEKLPFALLAYRTSIRTSTGATPFSLVYGMEAVLPIEVEIPSLRVLAELKFDEAEWLQSRYDQLNLIEEKRLKAICYGQMYQQRMLRAYNKKIWAQRLQKVLIGDFLLFRPPHEAVLEISRSAVARWRCGPMTVPGRRTGG
ncbi:uncharacterized protein LOC128039983 [Gossypium raimondii]|uniref:uncharacterized protein LOC128039983 n=1 Tax=Gossypium raimondii TaxID=29730 RepID=UPI00227CF1B3|nr:uncharacterized protein LOC128039983 [Gossypium raimondii]